MSNQTEEQRFMWMVKTAHLAPYYGISHQKKRLVESLKDRGLELKNGARIVKVYVKEVRRGR